MPTPTRTPATLDTRHPWLVGAMLTVALIVVGRVVLEVLLRLARNGLTHDSAWQVSAAHSLVLAGLGLLLMALTRPSWVSYGWRLPRVSGAVLWLLPALLVVVVAWVAVAFYPLAGLHLDPSPLLLVGTTAVAVGLAWEVWFRGLVLAVFRGRGARYAITASTALFALFQLVGHRQEIMTAPLGVWAPQVVLLVLLGWVSGHLVVLTGSLLPGWVLTSAQVFFYNLSGSMRFERGPWILLAECILLALYGAFMWRHTRAVD